VRAAFYGVIGLVVLAAPYVVGEPKVGKLTLLPIEAMIAVSLVILTGWAGQISLGHYGIVGLGGAIAGGLAARAHQDFFVTLFAGILAGAAIAVLIGLPALRVPGLYLAVTTLAFAAATENYFIRPDFPIGKRILPADNSRIGYPLLFGRLDIEKPRTYYYVCLVGLGAALLVASSFRRNHSGRVLIAVRDNQRAAPAYTINLARTKLAAFAVSGGIAAGAGVLLAYQQQVIDAGSYGIGPSIFVFITAVVGGLTSLGGAVLGAVLFRGLQLFASDRLALFSTSVGLLTILLFLPGGLAEAIYKTRDDLLRKVADRRGILVPSLVADRRVEEELEDRVIEAAEEHVEHVGSFEGPKRQLVRCPVCAAVLEPEAAPFHDHLQVGPDDLTVSGAPVARSPFDATSSADEEEDLVVIGAADDGPARRRPRRADRS
jgi:branched-chain amino acid transport system permease protein